MPPEAPASPVAVRLLSDGRHAGLLLPCADGRVVEYGYGAWSWYALLENQWWRAPATVLFPNEGTLGRRYVDHGDIGAEGDYLGGRLSHLVVPEERVIRLLARLDGEFASGGTPHENQLYDMHFVKHPERFWFGHLCHDEVAEWLRELGCSVSRAPIRTGLRVAGPYTPAEGSSCSP